MPTQRQLEIINAVAKVYTTRNPTEQRQLIQQFYSPNITFEDPLMRVNGIQNYRLQFFSLIKFFSDITLTYDPNQVRVSTSQEGKTVMIVPNNQTYKFARKSWLSQKILPEIVNIQAETVLELSAGDELIERHHDVWNGKQENIFYQRHVKGIVGTITSKLFQLIGW